MKNEKKQTGKVNYVWVLAGGYLIYLAYNIVRALFVGDAASPVVAVIGAAVFVAVGGWLLRREWKAYQFGMAHKDDPSTWSDEAEELPEAPEDEE